MTCKTCGEDKPVSQMSRRRPRTRINGVKVVDGGDWQPVQPCLTCRGKKTKAYYAENRERMIAATAWYREMNSDYWKSYDREYHRKNAEKRRLTSAARYEAKKDLLRAQAQAWRDRNREYVRAYAKRAGARRAGGEMAGEYSVVLRADPCSYCGGRTTAVDHIEPVACGGSNDWDNLTASCKPCNSRKRTRPLLVFLAQEGC